MPFAVMPWILWTVSEYILVAQFDSNFCSHIGEIVGIINGECPAPAQLRDVTQQLRSQPFFFTAKVVVINPNGIDHHVGFLHQRLDFALSVATAGLASI